MDSIRELDELYNKLEELKRDFNGQLNGMDNDLNEFHKVLINLSRKYPEHSELLEFIVFINDKLETNQTQYKQIISDTINKLIMYKQIIITNYNNRTQQIENEIDNLDNLEAQNERNINSNNGSFLSTLMENINVIKEIKWTVISLMIIVLIIGSIVSPKEVKSILSVITPFVTTVSEDK